MEPTNEANDTTVTKINSASIDDVNKGKREVVAVISTDSVDRDNEVVRSQGLRDRIQAGKAVVMVNHDYKSLPVGKALWVKAEPHRVIAKYRVSDKTQQARDVFDLIQDGVLDSHSIGFQSHNRSAPRAKDLEDNPHWKGASLVHRDWSMHEFSVVGIPANPEALALAVSKGMSAETIDFLKGRKEGSAVVEKEKNTTKVAALPSQDDIRRAFYETLYRRLNGRGK